MKSIKQLKKEEKIIAIIIALMVLVVILAVILIYKTTHVQNNNFAIDSQDVLFISENNENVNEEENLLNVELEEPNKNLAETPNTEQPNEANEEKPETRVEAPYYIKVNNQANVVTVYKKGNSGKYTEPIKAMVCSVGRDTPTSGVYGMSDKYTWRLLVRKCIWSICLQNNRANFVSFCTLCTKK